MKSYCLAVAVILNISISAIAEGNLLKCSDSLSGEVSNKTKLLKTYTREYWKIASQEVSTLPAPLLKTGFVAGDFHFNNAGIYYDYLRNRAEFQINDFDDAGINLLIVDFLKFYNYIQKLNKHIDTRPLFESYIQGLKGNKATPPYEIQAILYRSQYEFTRDNRKYIESLRQAVTDFDKSSITSSELEKVKKLQKLKAISRLDDSDYMIQVNDSGSSINSLRILFIGTDFKGVTGALEFKQLKCSATGQADTQDVAGNFFRTKKLILEFNPSSIVKDQYVYSTGPEDFFLVREKKKNFLKKIDLESLSNDRIAEIGSFYANYLGQIHSVSADSAYINSVTSNINQLVNKAKSIAKKFKDEVKD